MGIDSEDAALKAQKLLIQLLALHSLHRNRKAAWQSSTFNGLVSCHYSTLVWHHDMAWYRKQKEWEAKRKCSTPMAEFETGSPTSLFTSNIGNTHGPAVLLNDLWHRSITFAYPVRDSERTWLSLYFNDVHVQQPSAPRRAKGLNRALLLGSSTKLNERAVGTHCMWHHSKWFVAINHFSVPKASAFQPFIDLCASMPWIGKLWSVPWFWGHNTPICK